MALIGCANQPPGAPAVNLSPSSPTTVDDLVATVATESVDKNNDFITYSFEWLLDGVVQLDQTEATLPAAATSKGEAWSVRVIPHDGNEPGEAGTSEVTILNTAPTLNLAFSATHAWTDLVVQLGAEDADNDDLTILFDWTKNGVATNHTSDTVSWEDTTKDDVWAVTVEIDDGEAVSVVGTAQTTIINAAPEVSAVVLAPTSAYEGSELFASPAVVDRDGDTYTLNYQWFVNGTMVLEGETETTLDGADFDKHDEVTVQVGADDGETQGEYAASLPVTILNTAPNAPSIAITPATPGGGDDLVCAVVTDSADDDGDTVTYIYEWLQNGVSNGTGDTVSASSTVDGDEWTCLVTADDGEDMSTEASDSVGVGCINTIMATFPESGATDAHYRLPLRVTFTAVDNTAAIALAPTAGGSVIVGTSEWDGLDLVFTPDLPLDSSTEYTATLSAGCGTFAWSFTTSEIGDPTNSNNLIDRSWELDLNSGLWLQPAGAGAIITSFIDFKLLLGVSAVNAVAHDIDMLLALGDQYAVPTEQDICLETVDISGLDFSQNPYFDLEVDDYIVKVYGEELVFETARLTGDFAADGTFIDGATFSGTITATSLGSLMGTGGQFATCLALMAFGIPCDTCPSGSGDCIYFDVIDIEAEEAAGLTLIPRSPSDIDHDAINCP